MNVVVVDSRIVHGRRLLGCPGLLLVTASALIICWPIRFVRIMMQPSRVRHDVNKHLSSDLQQRVSRQAIARYRYSMVSAKCFPWNCYLACPCFKPVSRGEHIKSEYQRLQYREML